ncbi:MAG: rod shape-determining protein MreD [Bacteroidia bacterium]|jgi:rod shape-determining protein MreD|nr:rod shape-determining protein MreD [Bacteroidia bacterium]
MILDFLTYLLKLIGLLLVQLLVVNNIELSGYINPFVYVAFLLSLPVSVKPWQMVLISFLTGAIMDSFSSTPGLHMAACNAMGFLRIYYLRATTNKEDQEGRMIPSISQKGIVWFTVYGFSMIFIHHLVLFFLEIYGFHEFFTTLLRVLLSTLVSLLLIVIGQLLFFRSAKTNG